MARFWVWSVTILSLSFVANVSRSEIDIDHPAPAKRAKVRKYTTTVIEKTEDHDDDDDDYDHDRDHRHDEKDREPKERSLTAKFGARSAGSNPTAGCKTEELAQKAIKALKSDCNAWLKDRKAELKDKYVVGSCEDTCEDCGMHLQRCSVEGNVRYR